MNNILENSSTDDNVLIVGPSSNSLAHDNSSELVVVIEPSTIHYASTSNATDLSHDGNVWVVGSSVTTSSPSQSSPQEVVVIGQLQDGTTEMNNATSTTVLPSTASSENVPAMIPLQFHQLLMKMLFLQQVAAVWLQDCGIFCILSQTSSLQVT